MTIPMICDRCRVAGTGDFSHYGDLLKFEGRRWARDARSQAGGLARTALGGPNIRRRARPLKQVLLDEYGRFADARIKNIDRGDRFIVDDRTDRDYASDGQPFGWFCTIYVTVRAADVLEMWVEDTLPMSGTVQEWLESVGAQQYANGLHFDVTAKNYPKLSELASALRAIVRPGARYDTPAYKYVCPRTAVSLERLVRALDRRWR